MTVGAQSQESLAGPQRYNLQGFPVAPGVASGRAIAGNEIKGQLNQARGLPFIYDTLKR